MRFYEILADFMNFMNFMRCGRPAKIVGNKAKGRI